MSNTEVVRNIPQTSDNTITMLLSPDREYFWKRTSGWDWYGTERWWEVFVTVHDGFNGAGGYFVYEHWRWNGDPQDVHVIPQNLSWQESRLLERQIAEAQTK